MGAAPGEKEAQTTRCELCGGAAAVHCAADSAFLCLRCDARVHGANFLASRHRRRRLLLVGSAATASRSSSSSASSASSSGSCVSTADSAEPTAAAPATVRGSRGRGLGRKRRAGAAEAVLEGWAKRMGFAPGPARRRAAAALRALDRGVPAAAHVPLRVAMAAALWSEVSSPASSPSCKGRGEEEDDAALLCRLEATAHVPARLVLTVASWMARTRPSSDEEEEEGWAECSS